VMAACGQGGGSDKGIYRNQSRVHNRQRPHLDLVLNGLADRATYSGADRSETVTTKPQRQGFEVAEASRQQRPGRRSPNTWGGRAVTGFPLLRSVKRLGQVFLNNKAEMPRLLDWSCQFQIAAQGID